MAEATAGNHLDWKALGGLLLFLLGIAALNATVITSYTALFVLGWLLLIGGVAGFVVSFAIPSGGGIVLGIVSSILSFVVGALMLLNPGISLVSLTLLLAMYFIVDGIIRVAVSFAGRDEHRGWSLFYGVVAFVLGIAIWRHWPATSLYIFGVFIGIALIIKGLELIVTSFGQMQITHKARYA